MTKQDLENIYAETFSGIGIYYRDTTLNDDFIAQYFVGQILQHNGIVDMTCKSCGVNGNIRYLIASAKAKDVSLVNPNAANFGHFVLADETLAFTGGNFFVVLDIFMIRDKTQVTLLHIKKESISLFTNTTNDLEEAITKTAREDFIREANGEILPELGGSDWTERVKDPIGMDGQGNLLYSLPQPDRATEPNTDKPLKKKKRRWKFW